MEKTDEDLIEEVIQKLREKSTFLANLGDANRIGQEVFGDRPLPKNFDIQIMEKFTE